MRIVKEGDRARQDELVGQLVSLFPNEARAPKVIDRRASPTYGYRAVHVIVFPDAVPVEIQVRTRLQHEWADMFEKLADRAGRGIRYGAPPDHWCSAEEREALDPSQLGLYNAAYSVRKATVASALLPWQTSLPLSKRQSRPTLRHRSSLHIDRRFPTGWSNCGVRSRAGTPPATDDATDGEPF